MKTGLSPVFFRRISQGLTLMIFLVLFFRTDYQGQDELSGAVNLLFRIDPLVGLAATFASRTLIPLLGPSIFLLLSCFILGRWFCGWACPMGTLLDLTAPIFPRKTLNPPEFLPKIRYILLILIGLGALFGMPLVGYFDPFAILVRGLTMAIYPAWSLAIERFFTLTYQKGPEWLNLLTEPLYKLLRETVLPFEQKVFTLALPAFLMLLAVFMLELFRRRFFCRYLCPLGALLGCCARPAPFKVRNRKPVCETCGQCVAFCRSGAIDRHGQVNSERCILCLECLNRCPGGHFVYGRGIREIRPVAEGLSRRAFIGTALAGIGLPFLLTVRPLKQHPDPGLIRPPGALPETEFLGRCVRCGECMQVCIGNALHPVLWEAGIDGIFTPHLIPRIGYCEYGCTLCGQVCPTGAIQQLSLPEKQRIRIGRAYVDRNRCLPYAKGVPCLVCEEHCPIPQKAIRLKGVSILNDKGERVQVQQPYVIDGLCIGCGICENKCPLTGRSAILVTSAGETRRGSSLRNDGYP